MNYTKIENSSVYFRLNEDMDWKPISEIQGDDLILILEKALIEDEFELAEYNNELIKNEAHNIIYKSIYEKIDEIRHDRENILDENLQRYIDVIEKYSHK